MKNIKIGRHSIELSNVDKIYFPKTEITKKDVIIYYERIAPYMLPHVEDRLMVMRRFPHGIDHDSFFQKQISDYFPDWIDRHEIMLKKGEEQTLLVVNNAATLVYLANQAVLEFHSWLSRVPKVDYPDKMVFDLDPSSSKSEKHLIPVARALQRIIAAKGLVPFIMTTGSRGYHIVVPILPQHSFEVVHDVAKAIAHEVVALHPSLCTVAMSKADRGHKVFVDYLRNSFGQTSVACYSVRAREGAPIATPIEWKELAGTTPQKYTIKNIFKRLARKKDPWYDFVSSARRVNL